MFGKLKVFAIATLALFGFMVGGAHAAIDASVGTALTALQADATALSVLVIPVVVAILSLTLVIKLIKRFGNKI